MINHAEDDQILLTAYLGVYNGSEYLDDLCKQLQAQDLKDFQIVVVDNKSDDDSWERVQAWKSIFGDRIRLYRNERNLGGGGSLLNAINSGWIQTPWFAQIHQDDSYFPNHLLTLDTNIRSSSKYVVALCTSMASMNRPGERLPVKGRAMWLLKSSSPESSFLLNLRSQALSWPSSAMKTEEFKNCFKYWHSPTFSDTEATLLLCGFGEFQYIQIETMAYRENPTSESHIIRKNEALLGAAIGLTRVFCSSNFAGIISKIDPASRSKFYLELMSGISVRLSNSSVADFVKIIASEICWVSWQGSEQESANWLSVMYKSVDSRFTPDLIELLAGIPPASSDQLLAQRLRRLVQSHGSEETPSLISSVKISFLNRIYLKLPLKVRVMIFRFYSRCKSLGNPSFYWNFRWK